MNYIEKIPNWEEEYRKSHTRKLSKRELEILEGSDIKTNEGCMYGRMYAEWKDMVFYEDLSEGRS
tara:strand:- start:131 stop:325 length:195 start_codon:yes stop_codon:yes gene_type:complete